MTKLNDNQTRALTILHENEPMRPSDFARYFYPEDHPGWKKHMRSRNSVNKNHLFVMAGSYLAKLWKKGWLQYRFIDHHFEYYLSPLGQQLLGVKSTQLPADIKSRSKDYKEVPAS
jgi:hypothetical protein